MTINITLPRPHDLQRKVIKSTARWKILMCGRRWGKSSLAQILSITKALKNERVGYITPSFDLARSFFDEIVAMLPEKIISSNRTELSISIATGGLIKFFSGEALERLRGHKFHYIIIDEAAFIPDFEKAWTTAVRPTLSDFEGGALFISTPNGQNYFYSLFLKGKNKEKNYESFHYASNTNPFFPAAEFEEAKRELPKLQFEQEYLAIPAANQNNPFTDYHKNLIKTLSKNRGIIYGIDLAKYNDYTVITALDEQNELCYLDKFQQNWTITKERIIQLPSDIPLYIDATGVGDVVVESLMLEKENINAVKFTTESKPKMLYKLIKDVEQGNIKYTQEVIDEIETFSYKYTSTGHIKFEAQSGFHDDIIMSLAIANFYRQDVMINKNWRLFYR